MALQTGGLISLNDIHVEAGGATGTLASINDADIRGLINKQANTLNAFSEYYGASSTFWEQPYTGQQFGTPPSDGSLWIEDRLGAFLSSATFAEYFPAAKDIQLNVRSSNGNPANMSIATYFGSQSGKSFVATGVHRPLDFNRATYFIARGYTTGFLQGASIDYVLDAHNFTQSSTVNYNWTVNATYPHMVVAFECQTASLTSNGYGGFFDWVINEL